MKLIVQPGAEMRVNSAMASSRFVHQWMAAAMTMTSAQPSGMPVLSNVPSERVTRGSDTVCAKTARMPSFGSLQRISATADDQAGCSSRERVNLPVPQPSLFNELEFSTGMWDDKISLN